jgi:hypothetical protein
MKFSGLTFAFVTIVAIHHVSNLALGDGTIGPPGYVLGQPQLGLCTAIAAGGSHFAAIQVGGQVACWGYNDVGQCNVPAGLGPCKGISVSGQVNSTGPSYSHTLALRVDGSVVAWGSSAGGAGNVPTDLGPCIQVATGSTYSIALLTTGEIRWWGNCESDQCQVPSGPFVKIAAGNYHGLALQANGTVKQWGSRSAPPPSDLGPCKDISAGLTFSLALKTDGTVVKWGVGGALPSGIGSCKQIAACDYGGAAIRDNGTVVSWDYWGTAVTTHDEFGPCTSISGSYNCDSSFMAIQQEDTSDADGDGVPTYLDNCRWIFNPLQQDCDSNGVGDACEVVDDGAPEPGAVRWSTSVGGNGNWYKVSTKWSSWSGAVFAVGNSPERHLVTIQSAAENTFVASLFPPSVSFVWIGALRQPKGGPFHWVTVEPWGFTSWGTNEPNLYYNLYYAQMLYDGTWSTSTGNIYQPFMVEYAARLKPDCNNNGVPDVCDISSGTSSDCNSNDIPDSCDIKTGLLADTNTNGIPDVCEVDPCPGDISGNNKVDGVDLAALLGTWGTNGQGEYDCDIDNDGIVGGPDLTIILGGWGSCPN